MSNNAKKNTLKPPENTNKTSFEAFWEILENPVLGSKMWFSAHISNYAKIPWNTQKIPTKHVFRLFKNFLKIRFSAQKSGSRPRCRTMLKIFWNTQKTPTKHALRHFKKFLKIRFLAEKSGSRLRCRIMIKYHETLRKHQLNMFWDFLRNSWKSGSRLKKSGSRLRFRTMLKYLETLRKHQLNMFWGFLRNSWKSGSLLKNPVLCYRCRTMLKIPWNTQKIPPKYVLILNNLLTMVRCLWQPTLFMILQMICTDQNWGSC